MSTGYEARAVVFAELQKQHLYATSLLETKWDDVDEAVAFSTKGQLAQVAYYIGRLGPSGELGLKVASGTLSHEKWLAIAKEQRTQVAYSLKVFGSSEPTWSRFWDEVVQETANDVVNTAAAVTPDIGKPEIFGGLALVAVILVALVVLRVS